MFAVSTPPLLPSLHIPPTRPGVLVSPRSRPSLSSRFSNPSRGVRCSAQNDPVAAADGTFVAVLDSTADDPGATCFVIRARNRIGLLQVITRVFKVLGLRIERASIEFEGEYFVKKFFVTDSHGRRVDGRGDLDRIERALREAVDGGDLAVPRIAAPAVPVVVRRAGFGADSKAEKLFALMDEFLKNDPASLQREILYHVEYTVARSRFSFDDFEAYQVLIQFNPNCRICLP